MDEEKTRSLITNIYKQKLNRLPDEEGFNHFLNELRSGKLNLDDVPKIIESSEEFKGLQTLRSGFQLTKEGFGIYIDPCDEVISRAIAFTGIWEPIETEFLKKSIKEKMCVVDIGANIGYFTTLMSRLVGPDGKVLSFEPSPRAYEILSKNVKENCLNNVESRKIAISDFSGNTKLYLSKINPGDNRLSSECIYETDDKREITEVAVTTLDDYLDDCSIDLIKIDVQGAELGVINGAIKTIKNYHPDMIIEFWPIGLTSHGTNPRDLLLTLERLGYDLYDLNSDEKLKSIDELCDKYTLDSHTNLYCTRNEKK